MNDITGKWCYSTDEEEYKGACDTESAAHGEAQDDIDTDGAGLEDGDIHDYWVAQCVHPLDVIVQTVGDDIMEMLVERMADEIAGDNVPLVLDKERELELGKMVIDFVRQHGTVQQYGIKTPMKHEYIIGSNAA